MIYSYDRNISNQYCNDVKKQKRQDIIDVVKNHNIKRLLTFPSRMGHCAVQFKENLSSLENIIGIERDKMIVRQSHLVDENIVNELYLVSVKQLIEKKDGDVIYTTVSNPSSYRQLKTLKYNKKIFSNIDLAYLDYTGHPERYVSESIDFIDKFVSPKGFCAMTFSYKNDDELDHLDKLSKYQIMRSYDLYENRSSKMVSVIIRNK